MKTKHILYSLAIILLTASCNLDKFPSDKVSSGDMQNTENAVSATNGNYAMFKAYIPYNGYYTVGNTFMRHYLLMAELKGDNVLMSGKSTDPLFSNATLSDMASDTDVEYFWFICYKICYATSAMINAIDEDNADAELKHIKGENLFMRAFTHMSLCQIFAFPYALKGPDEIGVVLRTGPAAYDEVKRRASVGEVYEQCEEDLKKAIALMEGGSRRGNNGYIDVNTVKALLCRLYLYEKRYDECIALADELLGADPAVHLESDYEALFQNTKTSKEVLWCIALDYNETEYPGAQAMIGSMYNSQGDPGDGTGWAEIYYSQPLIDLFERYPEDQRLSMRTKQNISTTGAKMIYWPVLNEQDGFAENHIDRKPTFTDGKWTCTDAQGNKHTVETEIVGGYAKNYITLNGEKQYVTVADSMGCRTGTGGDMYPLNYMKKFSNQDGTPSNMASPAFFRYAEVILNRAEAKAHKSDVAGALEDVNVIRRRALLPEEAMFSESNMAERGYNDVLDIVLDERRMELCFEGFRTFDLQRNGKAIDRRYAGRQPYEVVQPDDLRLRYFIPVTEITATGIEQNNR